MINNFLNTDIINICEGKVILQHYFNIKKLPCLINSPLRKDNKPSFGLRENDGNVFYKDFATGEHGDIVNLLQKLWGIKSRKKVSKKIFDDLISYREIDPYTVVKSYKKKKNNPNQKFNLKITIRNWEKYDLDFWNIFGISKEWLTFGNIFPIAYIHYCYEDNCNAKKAEKYAYAYIEQKDNKITIKCYQPFSLHKKWISSNNSSVWELWKQLPPAGDNLIITSSRKDALCIWANTGIPSCSLQGEGYLPKPQVIEELKSRFKNIYLLYDNDEAGIKYSDHLSKIYSIPKLEIPSKFNSKDPSDLYKNHGKKVFIKTIKTLLTSLTN